MLQPQQLRQVAVQFAPAIATLQSFFRSAEPPLPTAASLAPLAARLRTDTFFQRDLGSHLLILHTGAARGVSTADLLAILAIAAAGIPGAAASGAEDTHEILRFLLAVTRAKEPAPQAPRTGLVQSHPGLKTRRWIGVATACLLAAAVVVGVAHHRLQPPASIPAATTSTAPLASPAASIAQTPAQPPVAATAPGATQERIAREAPPLRSAGPSRRAPATAATETKPTQQAATAVPQRAPAQAMVASNEVRTGSMLGTGSAAPLHQAVPTTARTAAPTAGAVPSSVLSRRLDARQLPTSDTFEIGSSGRPYPRLLRRRPLLAVSPDGRNGDGVLMADNIPAARPGRSPLQSSAVPSGTVTPVSLGMMAGNVLYSPAPAYPAAAAAARVQGEVTIQAEVDRDGTVASARVVSGPPLLRDAALDAVHQWRYRPRLVAGKAVTAAATAVVEFALP